MQECVSDIKEWMQANRLKPYDNKSEAIISGRNCHLICISDKRLYLGDTLVDCKARVCNLGTVFDQEMNMHSQIANICQSAYFHLRNIARIRKNLTKKSTEILVHATITSRLDQNNCLLVGATNEQLDKLQRVQNAAARLIYKSSKRDHITPILQDLQLADFLGVNSNFSCWCLNL